MLVEEKQPTLASGVRPVPPALALPPRLWPAVVLVVAYWGCVLGAGWLELTLFTRFLSRLVAGSLLPLLFLLWWWTSSRIRVWDRLFGFAVVVAGGVIVVPFLHYSVGGIGLLMGPLAVVLTFWLLWLFLAKSASPGVWRWGLLVTVSLTWGFFTLIWMDGLTGDLRPGIHWRLSQTPEQAFLASRAREQAAEAGSGRTHDRRAGEERDLVLAAGDWTGFRGPNADGSVRGLEIDTDWYVHPPRRLWKRLVGPAWSSMVVVAGRLFTQEQRDDREAIVCYDAATGKELWVHDAAGRYEEPTAGAGPRATPCFADGRLFALGPTGLLTCLDAATGEKEWAHDVKADSGAKVPGWGYSSSPLVVGGLVLVFAGGKESKNLLAYRASSGELAWTAPAGETSYASPQLARLQGKQQVLVLSNQGLTAVEPATGSVLWEHPVPLPPSAPRSVQPHPLGKAQVLVASEGDLGLALLDLKREGDAWTPTQRWVSKEFRPSFNNFVVQDGHVYGFDGRIFACVELGEGRQCWKDGRYGHGQVLLLADQSLLLVVSEGGEVILLRASPEQHEVVGRFKALKGKTWNDPVIVQGRLYLRNAEEMACYDLGQSGGR